MTWCGVCWLRMWRRRDRKKNGVGRLALGIWGIGGILWGVEFVGRRCASGECNVECAGRRPGQPGVAGDGDGERCGGAVGASRSGSAERDDRAGGDTELPTGNSGPVRRIEFTLPASAVEAQLSSLGMGTVDDLFQAALGLMYDGDLFHVETVVTENFAGTAYFYVVTAVE